MTRETPFWKLCLNGWAVLAALCPLAAALAVHAAWWSVWEQTGQRPHAGSPVNLGDNLMRLAGLLLLLAPCSIVFILLAFVVNNLGLRPEQPTRVRFHAVALVFAVLTFGLLLVDPFGALTWFMD